MKASLTAQDRCDAGKCGAQAMAIAVLPSGNELLFCRHHAIKHTDALNEQDALLITFYEQLTQEQE